MSQATLSEDDRGVILPKQSANIYTMLLILTFLAVSIGCLFLYLEMREYGMSIKVSGDAKVPPPPRPKAAPEPAAEPEAPAAAQPNSFIFRLPNPIAHWTPFNPIEFAMHG
jgi:hypothetical protein